MFNIRIAMFVARTRAGIVDPARVPRFARHFSRISLLYLSSQEIKIETRNYFFGLRKMRIMKTRVCAFSKLKLCEVQ